MESEFTCSLVVTVLHQVRVAARLRRFCYPVRGPISIFSQPLRERSCDAFALFLEQGLRARNWKGPFPSSSACGGSSRAKAIHGASVAGNTMLHSIVRSPSSRVTRIVPFSIAPPGILLNIRRTGSVAFRSRAECWQTAATKQSDGDGEQNSLGLIATFERQRSI